jgi:hypothetical protein
VAGRVRRCGRQNQNVTNRTEAHHRLQENTKRLIYRSAILDLFGIHGNEQTEVQL